jgi:hypothetical protein
MSLLNQVRSRITAENDQDRANMRQWWKETSPETKMMIWDYIQQKFPDPVAEIVSRFAQLAFAEALIEYGT